MKLRSLASLVAAASCLAWAESALARNPHCAGGIQYVVQGLRDKEKGNTEDYVREMNKAVDQLSQCAGEDSADFEALGYLGRAYAEVDSFALSGDAFLRALDGAAAKGDKKKQDMVQSWRDYYWFIQFNTGLSVLQVGQQFVEAGEQAEGKASYDSALACLRRADALRPNHVPTIRSLGTALAIQGDLDRAVAILRSGIASVGADTAAHTLRELMTSVLMNRTNELMTAKDFDGAAAILLNLIKEEPENGDAFKQLGNAYFNKAIAEKDTAARSATFLKAAETYSRARQLTPEDVDVVFNAAIAFQNCGQNVRAEALWRSVLEKAPNDLDALSSLGTILMEQKRYPEAVDVLHRAISLKPEEKIYYRQLGAVYSRAGNNPKSTEMLIVYMAMNKGTAAADPATTAKGAKAGSAAANTLAAMGSPDAVLEWDDTTGSGKLQTWVYRARQLAFTFNTAGLLVQKSDWTAAKK